MCSAVSGGLRPWNSARQMGPQIQTGPMNFMGRSWGVVDQPWNFRWFSYHIFWPEMGSCWNSPPGPSDAFLECERHDANALHVMFFFFLPYTCTKRMVEASHSSNIHEGQTLYDLRCIALVGSEKTQGDVVCTMNANDPGFRMQIIHLQSMWVKGPLQMCHPSHHPWKTWWLLLFTTKIPRVFQDFWGSETWPSSSKTFFLKPPTDTLWIHKSHFFWTNI